jgi:hypothetical protein
LVELGVGGRIILKLVLKIAFEDVDWIHLAQGKAQWEFF